MRSRLLLVVALAMLPILIFTLITASQEYMRQRAALAQSLPTDAALLSRAAGRVFGIAHEILLITRVQEAIRSAEEPGCSEGLRAIASLHSVIGNMARLSAEGDVICSARPLPGPINASDQGWFRRAMESGEFAVGSLRQGRVTGLPVIIMGMPVDPDEPGLGAVSISILADSMGALFRAADLPPSYSLFIFDARGDAIFSAPGEAGSPPPDVLSALLSGRESLKTEGPEGRTVRFAAAELITDGPIAVLGRVEAPLRLPLTLTFLAGVGLPLLLSAAGLLALWIGVERMSLRWIRHLRAVAIAHRRGMVAVRARDYEKAPLEFQDLAETLNSMADSIERRQTSLQEAIDLRETLLREVHHRVKNNLQVIISLFNLQARSTTSEAETHHLRNLQAHVEGLAIAHHAAYAAPNIRNILLQDFLSELLAHLGQLFGQDAARTIGCDIEEVHLSIDQAVPLAQLVVEAYAMNRLYRTGEGDAGRASITCRGAGDGGLRLVIDFGKLDPAAVKAGGRGVLSRSLIGGFARQLGGRIEPDQENRDRIILHLPPSDPPVPVAGEAADPPERVGQPAVL
ncbi:MAG: hypothetical protein HXY25_05095 [Alphaproteobacteria bacterium]|nr:hypothetical protein [Alphaproteobacteria bacterium]